MATKSTIKKRLDYKSDRANINMESRSKMSLVPKLDLSDPSNSRKKMIRKPKNFNTGNPRYEAMFIYNSLH